MNGTQQTAGRCGDRTIVVDGRSFVYDAAVTRATVGRGEAILYTSFPGEVPIYYMLTSNAIHWDEQKYLLPSGSERLPAGHTIIHNPFNCWQYPVGKFPRPEIVEPVEQKVAIAQYLELLQQSVKRLLGGRTKVAIAQSGGVDSILIAWALKELGIEPIALTVFTGPNDLDWVGAQQAMSWLGFDSVPIRITQEALPELLKEAAIRTEDTESLKIRMAIGNILMARKCRELGLEAIFTGNGQDDMFANSSLISRNLNSIKVGTLSERWRDARRDATARVPGHLKLFSSTFRGYGIEVLQPYYDHNFMSWVFSQPIEVLPVRYDKQFVRQVLASVMRGPWCNRRHSIGYVSGAGMAKRDPIFLTNAKLLEPSSLNQHLRQYRQLPISQRRQQLSQMGHT